MMATPGVGPTGFVIGDTIETVRAELMRPAELQPTVGLVPDGLAGRVLCGYQGWFNTPADGGGLGWKHWSRDPQRPPTLDNLHVDMLPDVTELGPDERFPCGWEHPEMGAVELFSSRHPATVDRHFRWMREYGIDGAFVQRFAEPLTSPRHLRNCTVVLHHCRTAAVRHGRVYAVMYDLTGLKPGASATVLEDWRSLRRRMRIGDDAASLRLGGRPLVAVWGIGFAEGTLGIDDCRMIVEGLLAEDCAVLAGVPTGWRTLDRDAGNDARLHELLARCQAISPWTVGRYATSDDVRRHADRDWAADLTWCTDRKIFYLPVVFPGFSWHNLRGGPLDQIPRRRGDFLWRQFAEAGRIGAGAAYVAMFDELDEGTAIFKCIGPPAGEPSRRLLGSEGLPSDHYLRLTGAARRLLQAGEPFPGRPPDAPLTAAPE